MLSQKILGLPILVWGIILIGVVYVYMAQNKKSEKFAETESSDKTSDKTNEKTKLKVMNFNTNWCGWSKRFQPEWDKFSEMVKNDPKLSQVEAVDVKCDKTENESMCEQYQVPGYPYVVIEKDGKQVPYNGERTAEALANIVM
jgi:thiol-disulfide isomerase/thioredoxin